VPLSAFRSLAACLPRLLRIDLAAVSGLPLPQVLLTSITATPSGSGTVVRFTLLLPRAATGSSGGAALTPSATPSALPSVVVVPSSLPSPSRGAAPVSEQAVEVRTRLTLVLGGDAAFRDSFRESIALATDVLLQGGSGGGSSNGTAGNATAPISTSLILGDVGAPAATSSAAEPARLSWGGVIGGTVVGAVAALAIVAYAVSHGSSRRNDTATPKAGDSGDDDDDGGGGGGGGGARVGETVGGDSKGPAPAAAGGDVAGIEDVVVTGTQV
jgi:hypothetical protein